MPRFLGYSQDISPETARRQALQEATSQMAQGLSSLGGVMDRKAATERQLALQKRQQAMQDMATQAQYSQMAGRPVSMEELQSPEGLKKILGEASARQAEATAYEREQKRLDRLARKNSGSLTFKQRKELKQMDIDQKKQAEERKKLEKQGKITADMRKAATFAERVREAEDVFGDLSQKGFNRADMGTSLAEALLPKALKPESLKSQNQAERNFINALLRRESGAAIAESEFESAEEQYFPRAGDSEAVLAQKAENRRTALAGLQAEAGERAISDIRKITEKGSAAPPPANEGIGVPGLPDATASQNYVFAPEQVKSMSIDQKRQAAMQKAKAMQGNK